MLELKNISLSVEDEFSNNTQKEILRDISFTVDSGKFVVITGPNGGGKSPWQKPLPEFFSRKRDRFCSTVRTSPV